MAGEFENRVIVLTGAAGGIGQATARQFAAAGAKLVLSDREEAVVGLADELVAAGGEAVAVIADVTHADQVARIAIAADETFGGVDVLVNNHGMILGRPFLETT
ncbi:MAG: SDR family NAD(P)-dependent oxidoreductase, partial [Thermoleophilia bacterium]